MLVGGFVGRGAVGFRVWIVEAPGIVSKGGLELELEAEGTGVDGFLGGAGGSVDG